MVPKLLRYPRQRWTYQGSHSSTTHLLRITEAWAKNWKTHPPTEPLLPKQEVICGRLLLLHSYTGSYSKFVSSEVISCPCGELQTRTHILRDPPPLPRPLPRPWGGPYHPDILDRRKGDKSPLELCWKVWCTSTDSLSRPKPTIWGISISLEETSERILIKHLYIIYQFPVDPPCYSTVVGKSRARELWIPFLAVTRQLFIRVSWRN